MYKFHGALLKLFRLVPVLTRILNVRYRLVPVRFLGVPLLMPPLSGVQVLEPE